MSLFPSEKPQSRRSRFIPTFDQLADIAKDLPDPVGYTDSTYSFELEFEKSNHVITFQRYKFETNEGKKVHWVYNGKIMIVD